MVDGGFQNEPLVGTADLTSFCPREEHISSSLAALIRGCCLVHTHPPYCDVYLPSTRHGRSISYLYGGGRYVRVNSKSSEEKCVVVRVTKEMARSSSIATVLSQPSITKQQLPMVLRGADQPVRIYLSKDARNSLDNAVDFYI